ncbi:ATP-binding protein [Nonomuraea sp. NPDC049504]|uniref:ATP-binding protein n=1 Tax=Nonomuraea sp. NPDC049504 TaxID=3154729 RepID=UPI0034337E83
MFRRLTQGTLGTVELRTPPLASAPQQARDLALAATVAWNLCRADEFILVVGELVTNAVQWARTSIAVRIIVQGCSLRVEVADGDRHRPRLVMPQDMDERHYGLMVVAALADRWGSEKRRRGKVVWAEFDLRAAAAVSPPAPGASALQGEGRVTSGAS